MKGQIILDTASFLPKYRQIVEGVTRLVEEGSLKPGDRLPSISELAASQHIAQVTVARAYQLLKRQGTVFSRHGKGFYVSFLQPASTVKIFLLFDTFYAYKEILYYALKEAVPENGQLTLFFHHYDLGVFESLINNNLGKYDYYLIMPHFNTDVGPVLSRIPREQLIILDKQVESLTEGYAAVYQDFEQDIFSGLWSARNLLRKYRKLTLVKSADPYQFIPDGILAGFEKFKQSNLIPCDTVNGFQPDMVREGEAYLVFADSDLIALLKQSHQKNAKLGKDIGVISYDDTRMKEVLEGGITVISTDFKQMGMTAGAFIKQKKKEKIVNPSSLIKRKSL